MFQESVARLGVETPYDELIRSLAFGDAEMIALIKATIATESEWNPGAINPSDPSYGLMQVLLSTARLFQPGITADQLMDPDTNIRIGVAYLSDQRRRYTSLTDAVAAYNAGSARKNTAGQYVNTAGSPIVQSHVDTVMAYFAWYVNNLPGLMEPAFQNGTRPGWLPWAFAAALIGLIVAGSNRIILLPIPGLAWGQGAQIMRSIPDVTCPVAGNPPIQVRPADQSRVALSCVNASGAVNIRVGDAAITATRGVRVGPGVPIIHRDAPAFFCVSEGVVVTLTCTETSR